MRLLRNTRIATNAREQFVAKKRRTKDEILLLITDELSTAKEALQTAITNDYPKIIIDILNYFHQDVIASACIAFHMDDEGNTPCIDKTEHSSHTWAYGVDPTIIAYCPGV
jgi:hypothetical protein